MKAFLVANIEMRLFAVVPEQQGSWHCTSLGLLERRRTSAWRSLVEELDEYFVLGVSERVDGPANPVDTAPVALAVQNTPVALEARDILAADTSEASDTYTVAQSWVAMRRRLKMVNLGRTGSLPY